ncbi:hypothetical protein LRR81_11865 [Metabacillus sp. GX 13764]|uniref:hypothetical protein n=1 Tax=Metabacillus kandeliae TaxID=2900151 RepID=UPI001E4B29FF|nr:hypothetical protein [Metabacillus kandeliae]MCD7034944.1 hypothetical protein [Metabacillus kandeliae]
MGTVLTLPKQQNRPLASNKLAKERIDMGKSNKSRRFTQQGKDTVSKHDERFPYQMTLAEAEDRRKEEMIDEDSLGGF